MFWGVGNASSRCLEWFLLVFPRCAAAQTFQCFIWIPAVLTPLARHTSVPLRYFFSRKPTGVATDVIGLGESPQTWQRWGNLLAKPILFLSHFSGAPLPIEVFIFLPRILPFPFLSCCYCTLRSGVESASKCSLFALLDTPFPLGKKKKSPAFFWFTSFICLPDGRTK